MKHLYSIGLDFGTESLRAIVVRLPDGEEAGSSVVPYPRGVITEKLPTGEKLPPFFALQDPGDYIQSMEKAVREALSTGGIDGRKVVGIGVDFTACTPLPVLKDGTPLCFLEEFKNEPHAWVKLWKHHGAVEEAALLNRVFKAQNAGWLKKYGGTLNLEWKLPKMLETWKKAPRVLEKAERFIEASDWIVWQLTGKEVRGSCAAGYKGTWLGDGYPPDEQLKEIDPEFPKLVHKLLGHSFLPGGKKAGGLESKWADKLGLETGTPVSAAVIDAHAAVPGCGVGEPGKMVIILGTSACHMLLSKNEVLLPGIQGVVWEGILPGFYGYEAGQAAVGDLFAWFAKNAIPREYYEEASRKGVDILSYMEKKSRSLGPSETKLVVLDWWNGNRSILIDPELSGLIVGLNMNTKPEHIFTAMVQAAAFGTRVILEHFEKHGLEIKEVITTGGIAEKNQLFLETLANATGKTFHVAGRSQACAYGAAVFGAAAAGEEKTGFKDVTSAAKALGGSYKKSYHADNTLKERYEKLFDAYMELHDHFGRGGTDLMKRLERI